jgi:hypothetical protein
MTGAPLTIAIVDIPQRFQVVNGSGPLDAGVKLLSYAIASPIGTVACTSSMARFRVPFVFALLAGSILQTVGFALLATVPTTTQVWSGQYGYYVIAGLGTGASIGAQYVMAPFVVNPQDKRRSHHVILLNLFPTITRLT